MNKTVNYIKSILIPILTGGIVGLIIAPFMNYSDLKQPFLAPPSIVFPIVWSILYILMGISYGILKNNNQTDDEINKIYYLQLIVNALWSIIFFILRWRGFAFLWIILLAILVINMIIKFYNKNQIAGLIQIPYLIWLVFAAYLNFAIYILNN